jgi:hypothetical protein
MIEQAVSDWLSDLHGSICRNPNKPDPILLKLPCSTAEQPQQRTTIAWFRFVLFFFLRRHRISALHYLRSRRTRMADIPSNAYNPTVLDPWTILDTLPDSLAVLDARGTIRYLNAAW